MSNWNRFSSLQKLQTIIDSEIGMNSYRLARYLNDISVDLNYFQEFNDSIWGYKFLNIQDIDLAQSPKINVIKSVIDSLVSKISNQKVRPYFTPVNGLYSTRAIVKQAQQFFDIIYDKEHVHEKITQAFRNSCIFNIGYVFFNPFTMGIEAPGSWQVSVLNTEKGYGVPTKALIEYKHFPVTQLDRYGIKGKYTSEYVNFKIYFDTIEHEMIAYINQVEALKKTYKSDRIPLVPVYHNKPVFGTRTISIVDELDGIQQNIDLLNCKISAAMQLTPANTTYVEAGSSLQPGDISNKTGNVYSVKMGPGHTQLPVVNVTPAPFDPMWMNCLDSYVKQAYEIVGISQLSAQSKKPSEIESGVALQTLSDIESDRFQVQVNQYVNAFVDLADLIIDVMADGSILPKSVDTSRYTWEDIRKQKELFKIQFSAMSILSKDPSTKLQQIMQLSQVGLITTDKIAQFLDSPDLEDAYGEASSITDAVEACIENAINDDNYEIPDYVSYQHLLTRCLSWENKLYASNDLESLGKVEKLKQKLLEIMDEEGFADLSNQPIEETLRTDQMSAVGATPEQELAAQADTYTGGQTGFETETNEQGSDESLANPIMAQSMNPEMEGIVNV